MIVVSRKCRTFAASKETKKQLLEALQQALLSSLGQKPVFKLLLFKVLLKNYNYEKECKELRNEGSQELHDQYVQCLYALLRDGYQPNSQCLILSFDSVLFKKHQ